MSCSQRHYTHTCSEFKFSSVLLPLRLAEWVVSAGGCAGWT